MYYIADKKDDIADEIENAGNKYKKTKELGITNCIEFIKYNQEYVDHLNSFKKKDDLCDAFLHAVHYIEKNFEPKVKITKKIIKQVELNEIDLDDNLVDNTDLIKPKVKKTKKIVKQDNLDDNFLILLHFQNIQYQCNKTDSRSPNIDE